VEVLLLQRSQHNVHNGLSTSGVAYIYFTTTFRH